MLRIGFDMDGTLADFERGYHDVEVRLFGEAAPTTRAGDPEDEPDEDENGVVTAQERRVSPRDRRTHDDPSALPGVERRSKTERRRPGSDEEGQSLLARKVESRRRRDVVWRAIQGIPDFWLGLQPIEDGAVRRIFELMMRHRWEVFFITQRPATAGDTVQRQTQLWLVEQGFDLPSVLVIPGSRGAAAGAIHLNYHVDDSARNCIDVKSESAANPLLIVRPPDEATSASARRLGIGTANSITHALDILEEASIGRAQPTLLSRLAKLVGWGG